MECDEGKCVVRGDINPETLTEDADVRDEMSFAVSSIVVVLLFIFGLCWIIKSRIRLFRAVRFVWNMEDGCQQPQQQQQQQPQQQQQIEPQPGPAPKK